MWLTRVSIHNPVFATMLMAALMVLGWFGYKRLPVEQFPDVSFPIVFISTEYPGAAPETVENELTRKIEEACNTIGGLKRVSSRSYEGRAVVILEFELTVDPVNAAQEVRDKIAQVKPTLREEIKEPLVARFDPDSAPIMSLSIISKTRSLRDMTTLADQIVSKRLQNVNGVGQITLVGGVKRQIRIDLQPKSLESFGIGIDQIMAALRRENQDAPVGNLVSQNQDRLVLVKGRFQTVQDFRNVIIGRNGGAPIYLYQVAQISDAEAELETIARVNGERAIGLDIVKIQKANTIGVVDGIIKKITEINAELPPDVRVEVIRDGAVKIRASVNDMNSTLIEGAGLTVMIVFLFLASWRSTIITGLTLPIALIGTFMAMYACGFSLNVLTLMALSLSVGLLIDDAIVVRENIVRHAEMGKSHYQAALEGTEEIGLAVIATTTSILAVFLPVAFMGGIIGKFFYQFGITVAVAVAVSLFVSFTLDPMLSSVWAEKHGEKNRFKIFNIINNIHQKLHNFSNNLYKNILKFCLKFHWLVLILTIIITVISLGLAKKIGGEFVPEPDLGEAKVNIATPIGSSLQYTEAKAEQVERALREFKEINFTYTTLNTGLRQGKSYGQIYFKLIDRNKRKKLKELMPEIRARLIRISGVTCELAAVKTMGEDKILKISLQGTQLLELNRISEKVQAKMQKVNGIVDIDSSYKSEKPALHIVLNKTAANERGLTVQQVGDALYPLLAGRSVAAWLAPDEQSYDVIVRLPETQRVNQSDIENLTLVTPRGLVKLRDVATFQNNVGASQINRRDLNREIEVTANVQGRSNAEVGKDLKAALAEINLPAGYQLRYGGSNKDMEETIGYASSALGLAVIFIYLILASQFGSFLQPIAIMMALPLALIGVLWGLFIAGSTLNLFSIIGFIMLMGLVTKNGILLIDFINQARKNGMERYDAILAAGEARLRPIVMTTAAMIFGMIPLALGLGEGGEQSAPMAHAVIGGLVSSTALSLLVVPIIYSYLDTLGVFVSKGLKRVFGE